uniref:Uncharacterized protein n=1 Tax=Anguilla anguilla TaxID=7936 RepID=A0A0E9RB55_ANGAN
MTLKSLVPHFSAAISEKKKNAVLYSGHYFKSKCFFNTI